MTDLWQAFALAVDMVYPIDPLLLEIVLLSLKVSLSAAALACLFGLPLGALLATRQFRGKWLLTLLVNTLMGMPPVVIGLLVYIMLSSAGPLGWLQWLYTPRAMIIAQVILITPIVAALAREIMSETHRELHLQLQSLCVAPWQAMLTVLYETRFGLLTVALAGFGRAIAEVGAVMIVGGNIAHLTRVMTTAIALETSKGDLALALALGIVLMTLALLINSAVLLLRQRGVARSYA